MPRYDNRTLGDRVKSQLARTVGANRTGSGKPHYVFSLNGRRIAYCYIRKNACSAFKRLIMDCSPFRSEISQYEERPIAFLDRYHKVTSLEALEDCPYRVFVYRDPVQRLTSLFINKFVVRAKARDILADFEHRTGINSRQASFNDFLRNYLSSGPLLSLDPHVWPQSSHLHRIEYTHAVAMGDLCQDMTSILGVEAAKRYFSFPVNKSDGLFDDSVADFSEAPAGELSKNFEEKGIIPRHEQLVCPPILQQISRLYAADLRLVGGICGKQRKRIFRR